MSTFAVKLVRIRDIEPIVNADAIEQVVVGAYRSVVRKDEFKKGELVMYIPEQSLVPEWLLKSLGLEGKLAGPDKNRVKAVKLRGCLSQGICVPVRQLKSTTASVVYNDQGHSAVVTEGENIAELLGITKYEPTIPQNFAGELYAAMDFTVHYDIENFKGYPDVLQEGEEVVMTEKLHGSFCGVGIVPAMDASPKHWFDRCVVFSKGLGARGLCLLNTENNANNAYIRALRRLRVFEKLLKHRDTVTEPFFVLGEVYGPGIQDAVFSYGHKETDFRIFDVLSGYRGTQRYYDRDDQRYYASLFELEMVPMLYRGPFSVEVMNEYTSGTETVSGTNGHMREGIVIKPTVERRHDDLGRVILKSVSAEYLLRKGGTEYN